MVWGFILVLYLIKFMPYSDAVSLFFPWKTPKQTNRKAPKHFWSSRNALKCVSYPLYTVKCLLNAKWGKANFSRFCTSDLSKPSKFILDLSKHSRAQCYLCIHLSFHQGRLMWSLLTLVSHHHHRSASALCALVTGIMDLTYNTYKLSWEPCKANGHKCTHPGPSPDE